MDSNFTILALETSCDETAAAVIRGGRTIISNIVASQIDEHRRYGGIVPEVASRQHVLALDAVVREALKALPGGWNDIHAVASTYGPGLAGALMTGLNAAKAIAWIRELPFVGVNHIEAHIYANWLLAAEQPAIAEPQFPLVALVVSGGHTLLALLEGHGCYRMLGQTRDDAAGEAFDKVARLMGLGFPGGPAIQQAAEQAPGGVVLPRAWLRDSYDFSFSGLKTAVLHQIRDHEAREASLQAGIAKQASGQRRGASPPRNVPGVKPAQQQPPSPAFVARLARAFQDSVVDVLVTKTVEAARAYGATEILLAGGVAANTRLRAEFQRRSPVPLRVPPVSLCTDNAAMIGAAAYYRFDVGRQDGWDLDVRPGLPLG